MRRRKTWIAVMSMASMVAVILSGCGAAPTSQDGRITFQVYSQPTDYMGEQAGWFKDELMDRFNVNFNYMSSNPSDFMLYMAQGNLGDIIIFDNVSNFRRAAEAGMLYDWNEDDLLSTYGTYIKVNYTQALTRSQRLVNNGQLYGIGGDINKQTGVITSPSCHPDLRYDLYEQLNRPEILTLEDYIPLLKQMQQLYPETEAGKKTYGVSLFSDWDQEMPIFVSQTASLYGFESMGFGFYDVRTKQWQDCLTEDGIYLRCLKFYHSLYQEGLLDPDSMTQGYDEAISKYLQGVNLFSLFDYLGSLLYNTREHLDQGYVMAPVVASDATPIAYEESIYGSDTIWAIGADASYPEECMEVINWLFTTEGARTTEFGPRGVTWDYDESGKPYPTDFGEECIANPNTKMPGAESKPFNSGVSQLSAQTISFHEAIATEDISSYVVVPASMYEMAERSEELDLIWVQVASCINEYSWNAIYASSEEEFTTLIHRMRQEVQSYGYEECLNFCKDEAEKRSKLE